MDNEKEYWKSITGYEGLYEISSFGRVRSLCRTFTFNYKGKEMEKTFKGRILKHFLNTGGYPSVILCENRKRHTKKVHILVAKAFIENPENKPEVNHKDGNKNNNHYLNLEWSTSIENIQHAFLTGLRKTGKENPQCKYGIQIIDKNNNVLFTVYGSNELNKTGLGLDRSKVFKVLNGKRKSHKGFIFRKVSNERD